MISLKYLFLGLILGLPVWAQTSGQPSCQFSYELTNRTTEQTDGISIIAISGGIARTPAINNRQQQCNSWLLQVAVDGLSASSIELDDSQNTYSISGGFPTTWAVWQGTVLLGSNPTTSLSTSATISTTGFYPWVSVNLNSSTGTGSIYVTLYGWKTPALLGQMTINGTTCSLVGGCTVNSFTTLSISGTSFTFNGKTCTIVTSAISCT